MNSITFPLGILAPPFYDENYPIAVNYGAMGLVAGHELSHGFGSLKQDYLIKQTTFQMTKAFNGMERECSRHGWTMRAKKALIKWPSVLLTNTAVLNR